MCIGLVGTDPRFHSLTIELNDGCQLAAEFGQAYGIASRGVIIFVHGFGGGRFENGLFREIASKCMAAGFDTLLYDWRGIGGSSGDFHATTVAQHASDFKEIVSWTGCNLPRQEKYVSTCAVGFSLGAAVVGLALEHHVPLDCVVYLSPAVRPNKSMWPRYDREQLWHSIARDGVVKKPGGAALLGRPILESLRDTDLGEGSFDLQIPLLVCHGTEDARVECSHTQQLVRQRKMNQDHFQYEELVGASHSFRPEDTYWPKVASLVSTWFEARA